MTAPRALGFGSHLPYSQLPYQGTQITEGRNPVFTQQWTSLHQKSLHALALPGVDASIPFHHLECSSLLCLFLQIFICAPNLSLHIIICPRMTEMRSHIIKTRNNFLMNIKVKTTPLPLLEEGLPPCWLLTLPWASFLPFLFIMESFKHSQKESAQFNEPPHNLPYL